MIAKLGEQLNTQLNLRPKVIGIAGGSCSGKTTFARLLTEQLAFKTSMKSAALIAQDNYYIDQSARFDTDGGSVNFDHPDSIDWELLEANLISLRKGQSVEMPQYDFVSHKRQKETIRLPPSKYVVLDGILIYVHTKIRQLVDYKIFIQANEDVRFSRRLSRDVNERGRTDAGVRAQFFAQVKPMHDQFVEPTSVHADRIISGEIAFTHAVQDVIGGL